MINPFVNGHLYSLKFYGLLSTLNWGPIPEWAITCIFPKILWVINKSTINYGPFHECAFTKMVKVIKYNLNYGLYIINTHTLCVRLSVPEISDTEHHIATLLSPTKELRLVTCINCLTSFLLECKVVNTLFASLSKINVRRTKPRPPLSIHYALGDSV